MSKSIVAAVLFGALTASSAVLAQDVTFDAADSNQDGFVSFEEISAVMPDLSEDAFKSADTDQDNLLNPDEFEAIQS